VLCPGDAYDRSPCGTGTSAALACLAADGVIAPGQEWIQESIIGSRFRARYTYDQHGQVCPSITGEAFVTMVGQLIVTDGDPFATGITR
ncbi:MAG: proline racemase family protein, partial [Roseiflexaceae bacterium]